MNSLEVEIIAAFDLYQAGNAAEAAHAAKQILNRYPQQTDALYLLGLVAQAENNLEGMRDYFERSILAKPDFPDPYFGLIRYLANQGDLDGGKRVLQLALSRIETRGGLRIAFAQHAKEVDLPLAIQLLETEMQAGEANRLDLLTSLVECYRAANDFGIKHQKVLEVMDSVFSHSQDALSARAEYAGRTGDTMGAVSLCKQGMRQFPEAPMFAHNLGVHVGMNGDTEEGERILRSLLVKHPDLRMTRFSLSELLLRRGAFGEGLSLFEDRQCLPSVKSWSHLGVPRWAGENLRGKRIAVLDEQGLGDCIMFARFVPLLAEEGASVTYFTYPPLYPLAAIQSHFDHIEMQILSANLRLPSDFDYFIHLMSIPHLLRLGREDLVKNANYLDPDDLLCGLSGDLDELTNEASDHLEVGMLTEAEFQQRKVGICWAANLETGFGRKKSINSGEVAQFPMNRKLAFQSLQLPRELADAHSQWLKPVPAWLRNFAGTARLMQELDGVISVDTSVAHLAASMGLKTAVLSQENPDWRWYSTPVQSNNISFWYPNATVFPQTVAGQWAEPISRATAWLECPNVDK